MTTFSPFPFPPFELDTDTGLFALKPLLIAGMVQPVVDGDAGINEHVVIDYPAGVLGAIDPYVGMQAGDRHDIYWDKLRIWQREVKPEEVSKRFFFYLPTQDIVPGWVEEVYYQLTRKDSTTPDDPSVPLRVLVKLDQPGGYDKFPHLPGHSELKPVGLPRDVIDNGVDAEWAKKGVPLTVQVYPGIRVYDVIYVYWGSVRLPLHVVTQAQVEGLDPIIIVADQAAILAGGNSGALVIEYEIRDEVWNWCQKPSLTATVRVDAAELRLEQPIIKDSFKGKIDLAKLGKDDATVQIHVRPEDFEKGDSVVMTWISRPAHGDFVIHHSEPSIIDNIPVILELRVPNAIVRAAAQGKVDVSYELTKANGSPSLLSKRTFAEVVGEALLLVEPSIREAIGATLEPTLGMATVDIGPSPLIKGGDQILLVWLGTTSGGDIYLREFPHPVADGEVGEIITLRVPEEHIKALENGKLELFYRVSNDSSAIYGVRESEHAYFNVEPVRADLPAPKVVEAPDGFLDPAWVPDAATLHIGYLGMAAGDVLTYYWRGPTAAGSTSDWLPITTVIAGKPVDFRIDKQFITPNLNRIVEVRYTLLRAATGRYSYSAALELYVGKEIEPTIDKVTDSRFQDIARGGTTVDSTLILTGQATGNLSVDIYDNGAFLRTVPVPASGTWTVTLSGLTRARHSFVAKAKYGSGMESPAWVVNIVLEVTPTIDKVTDSRFQDIASGGTTVDSTLILTGQATGNLSVDIYDDGAFLRAVQVPASGAWTATFSGLARTRHSFVAKANYGSGSESPAWVVNIVLEVAPTIDKVTDSQLRDIVRGGTTTDTTVILTGRGAGNLSVDIYDNGAFQRTVPVPASGTWTATFSGLAQTGHRFVAKSGAQESEGWAFTVEQALQFNTSPVTLSGKIYLIPGRPDVLPAFGSGTWVQHQATGGRPDYTYTSSAPAIAVVDSQSGLVTVRGRGTTTITVRDAAQQTKSYTVTVTGVIHCIGLGVNWWSNIMDAAHNQEARVPSLAELREIHSAYGSRWPMGDLMYWTWEERPVPINPNPFYHCKNLVTGAESYFIAISSQAGVCLKP